MQTAPPARARFAANDGSRSQVFIQGVYMKRLILSVGCLFAALGLVPAAQAQMVTSQSPASVAAAMQSAGFRAEVTTDDTGDPMIRSSSGGSAFAVFFYGCTKNTACTTVQFFAGYSEPGNASLSRLNEWNTTARFARAYLTDKGAARIEMDLDLDVGGMSRQLFLDNLSVWTVLMSKFEKHIAKE